MLNRRKFVGSIPIGALCITATAGRVLSCSEEASDGQNAVIASPPVVQNPHANGFGVSIAVSRLATAWIEYGFSADDLAFTSQASHHGLIAADDQALHVRVKHREAIPLNQPVFYRVLAQPLTYERKGRRLKRGEVESTPIYVLRLPNPKAQKVRVVSINDTHENSQTLEALHQLIEKLQPDLLIWNGDTCNDFDEPDSPSQILLNPAKDTEAAWAATRPLVFSNGNHDVRGQRAREVVKCLSGNPTTPELPYNQSIRIGPLALIVLDTGEDKPDRHPVFAGTAAYEPYREEQAQWLKQTLKQEAIASAPFKIATTHIPLRGLKGQNDGTTLIDYARFSGFGSRLWLPQLEATGVQAVLSGHTHNARHDLPDEVCSVHQFIGGGPRPDSATVTIVEAETLNGQSSMKIRVNDLNGKTLFSQSFG